MLDNLYDIRSEEYKRLYTQELIKKGVPHDMAKADYEAWEALLREQYSISKSNPVYDAGESMKYWED
jgi:hypothetical protein